MENIMDPDFRVNSKFERPHRARIRANTLDQDKTVKKSRHGSKNSCHGGGEGGAWILTQDMTFVKSVLSLLNFMGIPTQI